MKDCCAATCTQSICGTDAINEAFGVTNVSGDGFPHCRDSVMVPLTIHLDDFIESKEPQFFLDELYDANEYMINKYDSIDAIVSNIDEFAAELYDNSNWYYGR
jgi:hypothetical protein